MTNSLTESRKKYFTTHLVQWHQNDNSRSLPWKNEKDPYKIWLSEIILQQTRAQQGLPYYTQFISTYPTIKHLAAAPDEEVFRIWQGLGYYNRCKNMLATARYIAKELKGKFPDSYESIVALKGIGTYTAAAIASFAFNLPYGVVDGNVYRVLSRYFGIDTPTDTTEGKKLFATLAQQLLDINNSAGYNQAIMDLGATVCTPKKPLCGNCPLQKHCIARQQDMITLLPVKSKKVVVATRYFNYLLLQYKNFIWLHKRTENDIWANLYEPYLIETTKPLDMEDLLTLEDFTDLNLSYSYIEFSDTNTQRLTHRIINSSFFTLQLESPGIDLPEDGIWVTKADLPKIAFPKTVLSFLNNNLYF